jgi:peptidoglycan/LPS O-acetylase OafA/YrhL
MVPKTMTIQNNLRLYYLDAVRSYALLLGIAFHTALSYMPIYIGWAVMDVSTSDVVPGFVLVSHSFRMALFFLIAGYFSHMAMHKNGIKPFIQSRLMRIGLPLLIGWFVLKPLLVSGWIMGAESMRGDVNIMNGLTAGYASLAELPQGLFIGTHLWFLHYLLLISASVIILRSLLCLHVPTKHRLTQFVDRIINWINRSSWMILLVALPTAAGLWFMQHWGLDTPDKSLVPHIPLFMLYGGFFMFGWLLHRNASLIESFAQLSWNKLFLCVVSVVGSIYLSGFEGNFGHPQYSLFKASFILSYAVMMWSLISLSIGLCKKWFFRPNRSVQYVADASYWLYLVHLPIVIWLQIAFAELPFHWAFKLISIFVITIGLSLLMYDLVVRSTFIGAILNGKRKSRALFTTKLDPRLTRRQMRFYTKD